LAGVVTFLQLLFPIFTQMVVDKVVVGNDIALLTSIMLAMGVALIFMQAANLAQQFLLSFAAVRIDAAILAFLTRQMLSLPMSYDSVIQSIGLLSTALFLWVGAHKVIAGQMTIGAFVAFSSLAAMAYAAILRTLGIWDQLQQVSVLLNRLNDVFEAEPEQGRD